MFNQVLKFKWKLASLTVIANIRRFSNDSMLMLMLTPSNQSRVHTRIPEQRQKKVNVVLNKVGKEAYI